MRDPVEARAALLEARRRAHGFLPGAAPDRERAIRTCRASARRCVRATTRCASGQDPSLTFAPAALGRSGAPAREAPAAPGGQFLRPVRRRTARCRCTSPNTCATACATAATPTLAALPRRVPPPHARRCSTAPAPAPNRRSAWTARDGDRFSDLRRQPVRHRRARRCASATTSATSPSCTLPGCWRNKTRPASGLSRSCAPTSSCRCDRTVRRPLDASCRGDPEPHRLRRDATATGWACSPVLGTPGLGLPAQVPHRHRPARATTDYQRLLPGGDSLRRLLAWVRNYAGLALDWDVRLILKKEAVPPLRLGGHAALGWTTWLASAAPTSDAGPVSSIRSHTALDRTPPRRNRERNRSWPKSVASHCSAS